jgi:hypothetical protein
LHIIAALLLILRSGPGRRFGDRCPTKLFRLRICSQLRRCAFARPELCPLDRSDELAANRCPRLRLNERLRADSRSLCRCCVLSERNRWNEQHSATERCPHHGLHFFKKGARQILQCVGQIKIGSSAQALYQTPNFRRHGKPNGIMPVLSSSPTSKSQSSGASSIGSHGTARRNIPKSLEARATNAATRLWKLPICLNASCRSDPSGSRCAASHKLASNRATSFNSSFSDIPTVRRLNFESS